MNSEPSLLQNPVTSAVNSGSTPFGVVLEVEPLFDRAFQPMLIVMLMIDLGENSRASPARARHEVFFSSGLFWGKHQLKRYTIIEINNLHSCVGWYTLSRVSTPLHTLRALESSETHKREKQNKTCLFICSSDKSYTLCVSQSQPS